MLLFAQMCQWNTLIHLILMCLNDRTVILMSLTLTLLAFLLVFLHTIK